MSDNHILTRTGQRASERYIPNDAICAEIGVWKGTFSDRILTHNPKELWLIDPWIFNEEYPWALYGGAAAKSQADMDAIFKMVDQKYLKDERVFVWRMNSYSVGTRMPEEFFDWVYIDGDHTYLEVQKDLNTWATKVKRGGHLCGDDYMEPEVKRAVDEFIQNNSEYEAVHYDQSEFVFRRNA